MNIISERNIFVLALTLCGIVLTAMTLFGAMHAEASAPSGLPATVATTSTPAVTSTASLVFATSSMCVARVISTAASGIMATFSDFQGDVPSAAKGFYQPASTTQVYDSGQYGCGALKIYSFSAQTITVMESR